MANNVVIRDLDEVRSSQESYDGITLARRKHELDLGIRTLYSQYSFSFTFEFQSNMIAVRIR